jgi:hypothetical protein
MTLSYLCLLWNSVWTSHHYARDVLKVGTICVPCPYVSWPEAFESLFLSSDHLPQLQRLLSHWVNRLLCHRALYREPCQSLIPLTVRCVWCFKLLMREIFALPKSLAILHDLAACLSSPRIGKTDDSLMMSFVTFCDLPSVLSVTGVKLVRLLDNCLNCNGDYVEK